MYPYLRMVKEMIRNRKAAPLGAFDTHVSHHICWPQDIDPWRELNNGRTLTLYDLGRVPLAMRVGLFGAIRKHGWGLTVAGSSVRYRRRVRLFDRIEMHSRLAGWDDRFLYIDQSMWRPDGDCCSQALIRMAVVGPEGIVPPETLLDRLRLTEKSPELPEWIKAWAEAEGKRPWPPEQAA